MDINLIRTIVTVLSFICFVAILLWAYSSGARRGFNEAERLPFADDDKAEKHETGNKG